MTTTREGPRIILAADHGGVALKADLLRFLSGKGYAVRDLGTGSLDPVDYPDSVSYTHLTLPTTPYV